MTRHTLRMTTRGALPVAALCAWLVPLHAVAQSVSGGQPGFRTSQGATLLREGQSREPRRRPIPRPTVVLRKGEVPNIEFDTPVFDFGRVMAGTKVSHDFWLTNTGTGPLEILAVRMSCGCTSAGQYDRIIQPGESGHIPVKVATDELSGKLTKTVTIHTNIAPPHAVVSLQVKGEVWEAVAATPRSAVFGKITSPGEVVRKLSVVNNTEDTAELTDLSSNNPTFRAEVRVLEPGRRFEVTVTATPPFVTGNNEGVITMSTGVSDMPKLQIYASAYVPPTIDVTPKRLAIPVAPAVAKPFRRRLYVRNHDVRQTLKLSGVVTSNPQVTAQVTETVPGRAYQIILSFPAGYRVPQGGDRLTFKTNAVSMPQITVPIVASRVYTDRPPGATNPLSLTGGGRPATRTNAGKTTNAKGGATVPTRKPGEAASGGTRSSDPSKPGSGGA